MISQRLSEVPRRQKGAEVDDRAVAARTGGAAVVGVQLTVEPGDGGERREIGRDRACATRIEVEHPEILERGARTLVYAHIRMVKRSKIECGGVVAAEICPDIVTVFAALADDPGLCGLAA